MTTLDPSTPLNSKYLTGSIFRNYDIRGIYPDQLNEETAYKIGRAFVEYTGAKEIVVGQDMRLSSPHLFKALTRGISDQGADVLNIGQAPIDCLYFSVGHYGYDAGIMITASHNPPEYNGFKMVKKGVEGVRGTDIYGLVKKNDFSLPSKKGKIIKKDIWQDYLSHIFSFVNVKKIKPKKVVVDTGNGMAGKVIPFLEKKLTIKIIPLNFKLDGSFPAHSSNPLIGGACDQISQTVKDKKADFGFIFDGDADRIFLIDEKGSFIPGDITILLLAKYFLEKNLGAGIVYNLICSKSVPEFIKKWSGKPIRSPVGYVNIRENMIKNQGLMGGELSGHYAFKDNFYSDSGFIAFLILLQIISQNGRRISGIVRELNIYKNFPEINFKVENKEKIIEKFKEKYLDAKQDFLDGLTAEYSDWWFNLRPSNTEPLVRLRVEAKTQKLLKEKTKELTSLIKK